MPKSKVRKKSDFTVSAVSRTPVKVKAGPSSVWFVVLFCGLMLIGLIWLMVFQLAATGPDAPSLLSWMANLGPWNYAVAFAFMIRGLLLTMGGRWVRPPSRCARSGLARLLSQQRVRARITRV